MSKLKLIITMMFFELETFAYLVVNRLSALLRSRSLLTPADTAIPLRPRSLWLYLSFVPYCLMIVFDFGTFRRMFRVFFCIFLNSLVAYRSFLKWPSTYPRPLIPATEDAPLDRAWQSLCAVDRPSNTFPSIHVSHAFLLALMMAPHVPKERTDAYLLWANGIALSTLLTKQHYVVDITGGILTAEAIATHVYQPWEDGRLGLVQALRRLRSLCAELDAMALTPEACRLPAEGRHPRIAELMAVCHAEGSFVRLYDRMHERHLLFERKSVLIAFLGTVRGSLAVANAIMPGWLQFIRDVQHAEPRLTDSNVRAYLQEFDQDLVQLMEHVYELPGANAEATTEDLLHRA